MKSSKKLFASSNNSEGSAIKENNPPEYLYHGSFYKQSILKPGIYHTKKLIQWDDTESNRFLYLTSNKNFAAEMGFATSLTQIGFITDKFSVKGNDISITTNPKITMEDINKIKAFYVYTVKYDASFIQNSNKINNACSEYKTDKFIFSNQIATIEKIAISDFLKDRHVILY